MSRYQILDRCQAGEASPARSGRSKVRWFTDSGFLLVVWIHWVAHSRWVVSLVTAHVAYEPIGEEIINTIPAL